MDRVADSSGWIGRAKTAWAAASVTAMLVLGLGAPGASAAPSCVPSGTNIVCSFTTLGPESFTVPPGVTQVTLDAFGAQGGGHPPFSYGGLGGEGQATIAVAPGQALQVNVGGAGGDCGSALPNGGVNGGGTGGASTNFRSGAGGGGASDVRTGSFTLAERVVVGGGGGGGGTFLGGAGGGTTGGTQTAGSTPAAHGTGGTQSAGGTGGSLSGSPERWRRCVRHRRRRGRPARQRRRVRRWWRVLRRRWRRCRYRRPPRQRRWRQWFRHDGHQRRAVRERVGDDHLRGWAAAGGQGLVACR